MKRSIRENIIAPYSLHDMNITAFEISGDDVLVRTQSGIIKTTPPYSQPDGHIEFHNVRWDFSYVYLLDFAGNVGSFTGKKMFLKDFVDENPNPNFTVIDEAYGYNCTKYSGYITIDRRLNECTIEIYHEGDMVFVDENVLEGMKEVVLSADNEAKIYSVPAEVAYDLDKYCWQFAAEWIWHGPENARFLHIIGNGQLGAIYDDTDFIDYLNKWLFPQKQSKLVKNLGCFDYELPEEYKNYPRYNF